MIRIAVVILNYNGEKLLSQFLPSVIDHSFGAEIVVADNGSTDQSVPFLKRQFPTVRCLELPANYGFCKGYNEALRQVRAEVFILLNSDVEVTAGWLDPIRTLFEKDPEIAAVQPKILSYREKNKFEYAGAGGGLIDTLGYPFCRGRVFDHVETDRGQYNDEREIFWASGACMAIRSGLYDSLGGLDENFFAHMEEIDLCWKIHRSGKKVMYCGSSTVYHLGAGTLAYASPRKTFLNFRNNLSMLYKHYRTMELVIKMPLRMFLDWLAAFVFLIKGEPGNMWAVFRAQGAFLGNLPVNTIKRKELRKFPHYRGQLVYKGSILADYYLKKKKEGIEIL
jgi:GT2 family glycosyltransferase